MLRPKVRSTWWGQGLAGRAEGPRTRLGGGRPEESREVDRNDTFSRGKARVNSEEM